MTWLILSLLALVFFAFSNIIRRSLLQNDNSPLATTIVFQIIIAILFFIYALLTGFNWNGYLEFWPNILLMVVLYGIGGYLLFLSFKFNDASTATILASTQIIWSIFAGMILLGDNLGFYQIIGVVLVILAVIIINLHFDKSSKINSKGLIYGLIAAACFGVAFINDNYIIGDKNIPSYFAVSFLLPALVQIIFLKNPLQKLRSASFGANSLKLFSLSLIYALSTILLFMARQIGGTAAIVNTIQQTSIVLTVILAAIFLKEKENLSRKLIASLLCVIAVVLFTLS